MSDLSSYEERQEDEVEFLQAVFPNPGDFQDLRLHDTWKVYYSISKVMQYMSLTCKRMKGTIMID